jgi:hypothetical protein
MTPLPPPWTMETVTAGARFYHEIAGVGLVFPRESSLGWTAPSTPPSKSGTPPLIGDPKALPMS